MDEPTRPPARETGAANLAGFRWLAVPVTLFILSRVAIFTISGFSLLVDPDVHHPQDPVASNLAVQGLTRWDGGWFLRIAKDGYTQPIHSNFFPLFPLMGRYVSRFTGLSLAAALVLCANVCSLAAVIIVYRIFLEIEGEQAAGAALALLIAWPFSFFQAAAYPESMMMLSTAGAIYLAMRQRHFSAGVVLGIGILARHLTALGGLTLLAHQIRERGFRPRRFFLHRDFLGLLAPLAVFCVYLCFLQLRYGDFLVWIRARGLWGTSAWWGIGQLLTQSSVRQPEVIFYVVCSIVPGAGAVLLLGRARWRALAAFGLGLMLLLWLIGLAGLGRYSGSCWPAFLPLGAMLARRRTLLMGSVMALAMTQGMMLYLFVHLFTIQ